MSVIRGATGGITSNLKPVSGLRVVVWAIISAMFVVALVPLVVMMDLAGGGDGWGLCPGGVASCRASYFDGPELLGLLGLALFVLFALLHFTRRAMRRTGSFNGPR